MMKIPSILQLCLHQRNKYSRTIIKLFTQFNLTPQQALETSNTNTTFSLHNTKAPNFSTSKPCASSSNDALSEIDPQSHPNQNNLDRNKELSKVVKFLMTKGCSSKDIKNKCMQYVNSTNNSYMKAMLVSELHSDIPLLMPLMSCSLSSLRMAAKLARYDRELGFPDRVSYLAHHLETPTAELIPALAKHASLLTMQFDRLERKMDTLRAAGISPRHIAKDLWIFNYKEELLAERIAAAQKAGVELRPWILRCSMKTFNIIIEKNSETQSVLKGEDETSYLAKRLDCGKEYVEYIMDRNKLLKAIGILKLDKVLNFLYEKGYTPAEVRLFPRVFCSSVQTLNKRFNEFSALKSTLPTMSQLCVKSRKCKNSIEPKSSSE